ncbi:hypothetical protein WA026_010226 [Henosepilachna vigintioctopunctata]|uniref:Anoctamin n=1 Tax=Henosepilachna vigintioctopunctata TaxID=420089 RepID=A0AAW1UHL6_9CUCU
MIAGLLEAQYEELTIEEKIYNLRKIVKYDVPEPTEYYFRDGVRKIHYIIVLQDRELYKRNALDRILRFLYFLEFQGLQFEFEMGMKDTDLVYVKVHASDAVMKHYANLYDIDIDDAGHNYIADNDWRYKFRQTELTENDRDVFKRRGKPTSGEIIILLYKILSDPLTFEEKEVYGLDKMIKLGYIKDAYPLHDGPWEHEDVPKKLWNDRQKLSYYWANFPMWYKEAPINLLETYFGTDISFYFAWSTNPRYIQRVCNTTNDIMCPICETEGCHLAPLSSYCHTSIFENILGTTIQYALVVAIWVAVFYKCWSRRECTLSVRWNVYETDVEYKIRYDYKDKSSFYKKSKITGKIEPFVPVGTRIYRSGFTYIVLGLLVSLVVGYVLLLSFMKSYAAYLLHDVSEPRKTLLLSCIYGIFQAMFIKCCSMFYVKLSVWLTNIQVPKTESEYEDSIIYKMYLFGFLNNYIPIFYTALLRDNLILLPGEFLLQLTLMRSSGFKSDASIPTWEREFYLMKTIKSFMVFEFSEMMIQFGYVGFFMSMCPLFGPIVFFSNILKTRLNAIKLIRQFRRPIPRRSKGIGAWNDILLFSSYFSVVCNAFIIGFNTRLILFAVHRIYLDVEKTFFEFVFSRFDITDLPSGAHRLTGTDCIFAGQRYPPIHKYKYKKTNEHYAVQSCKFIFIIIFENFILLLIGVLFYFVNAMPRRVKEQLRRDKMYIKDIKMKILEKKLHNRLSRGSSLGHGHY